VKTLLETYKSADKITEVGQFAKIRRTSCTFQRTGEYRCLFLQQTHQLS